MKTAKMKYPYVLTKAFLFLSLSAFLLYVGTNGYEQIQLAKQSLFLTLFGGYLILMALLTVEQVAIGQMKLPGLKKLWSGSSMTQRFVAIYWLVTAVSTILSPYREVAFRGMSRGEGLLTISIYCGVFLCVSSFGRMSGKLMLVFGAAMTVFAAIALLQMQGYNPLSLYPNGVNYFDADIKYPGVYLSTAGNAGLTAAVFSMAIPLFGVTLLREREKWTRWLAVPLVLCLIALLQSNIQAGILAILLGTLLIVPAVLLLKEEKRKWLWIGSGGVLALGLLLALLLPVKSGTLYELQQILHGNWDGDFGTGRIRMWREVLKLVPQHLLLGAGPDTMAAAQVMRSVDGAGNVFYVDVAHNEYLNILYHQGVLGLLPYLAALGCSAAKWLKQSPGNRMSAALGGAVLCYCIQAFFSFSMCQSAGIFWILWGLLESEFYVTEGKK